MVDLLTETGKLGCKPVDTPIEQNHRLCEATESVAVNRVLSEVGWKINLSLSHKTGHSLCSGSS